MESPISFLIPDARITLVKKHMIWWWLIQQLHSMSMLK